MKPNPINAGDFVKCRSAYHRDQLQLPDELGLVIEIKRNNYKILFANDKRCWLPRETLSRVQPELDYGTFLEKLHYVIKKVQALDCELVSDQGQHRLTLRIDRIDHDTVTDLRQFIGEGFGSLVIVPEGMAFMLLELRFQA